MSAIEQPPVSSCIVLLNENEPLIMVVSKSFTHAGFTDLKAPHAEEALDLRRAPAHPIHVLFIDIHSPAPLAGWLSHTKRGSIGPGSAS